MIHNVFFFRSQYFDEDGQLAHEFYELKKNKITDRISMTRMDGNLVPQVISFFFICSKVGTYT